MYSPQTRPPRFAGMAPKDVLSRFRLSFAVLYAVGQGTEDWDHDQGQQGGESEAEDYGYGHGAPPLGGLAADVPDQFAEVEADAGGSGRSRRA